MDKRGNMLTTGDVSFILRVHPNTVSQWSNQRIIKPYRTAQNSWRRFRLDEIVGLHFERVF
ncbi:helix-turn-helix domain-containing protein [Chloroflexota bacterium]